MHECMVLLPHGHAKSGAWAACSYTWLCRVPAEHPQESLCFGDYQRSCVACGCSSTFGQRLPSLALCMTGDCWEVQQLCASCALQAVDDLASSLLQFWLVFGRQKGPSNRDVSVCGYTCACAKR